MVRLRVGVVASATGPVEHVLGDGRVKTWLGLWIGELSGDNGIYVIRRVNLSSGAQWMSMCAWGRPRFWISMTKR